LSFVIFQFGNGTVLPPTPPLATALRRLGRIMANRLVKPLKAEKPIMNTLLSISFDSEFITFFNIRPLAAGPFIKINQIAWLLQALKYTAMANMRQIAAGGLHSYHFIVKTG
jgi:hypothetical protein